LARYEWRKLMTLKSDRQVMSGGFPPKFVGIAWTQWLGVRTGHALRDSNDAVARRSSPKMEQKG
jgi:hypothetical protein